MFVGHTTSRATPFVNTQMPVKQRFVISPGCQTPASRDDSCPRAIPSGTFFRASTSAERPPPPVPFVAAYCTRPQMKNKMSSRSNHGRRTNFETSRIGEMPNSRIFKMRQHRKRTTGVATISPKHHVISNSVFTTHKTTLTILYKAAGPWPTARQPNRHATWRSQMFAVISRPMTSACRSSAG